MRRIQLHIDEDLDEALSRRATERGMPKAALVREILWASVPTRKGLTDDPSQQLIGIYEGELDESVTVDEIVYS